MRAIYAAHGEAAIDLHKAPTLDLRVAAWRHDLELVERARPGPELGRRAARPSSSSFERQRMHEIVAAQEAGAPRLNPTA